MSIAKRFIAKPLALAVSLSAASISAPTLAAETFALEEIVVTAQKRAESTQDIGASVSAVTGDSLGEYSVLNFSDVEKMTVGLTLDNANPRNQTLSMRGVSYDSESTTNAAVDAYWNGVAVRADVAFGQMFDLERVEVLRGPQGTLQGKTSPAGAISFITRKPSMETLEADVQVTVSDSGGFNTQFGASLPIVEDSLALRIAGSYDESELAGIENITTGSKQTGLNRAGRFTLVWEASDRFSAELVHEYSVQNLDDPEAVTGSGGAHGELGSYSRTAVADGDNKFRKRNKLTALTMNWDVLDHTLTSVSGYQDNFYADYRDLDMDGSNPGVVVPQIVEIAGMIFTQELRLSSAGGEFWDYIVGAYYESRDLTTNFYRDIGLGPAFMMVAEDIPNNTEEFGLFSHNTFQLTDDTRLQAGLRWQKIRHLTRYDFEIPGFGFSQEVIPDELSSTTTDAFTGTLKVMHDLSDEMMVYVSLDRSYRPSGVTIAPILTVAEDLIYDEETSNAFELGIKSMLWDGRLQLNGAIYHQQFDGYNARIADVLVDTDFDGNGDSRASGINFNGDAIIRGAELDFTVLLTQNWTLGGGASYNDAKYDNAEVPCDGADGSYNGSSAIVTCSSNGRVAGEPNWSVSLNSEYVVPFDEFEVFSRGLYKFKDSSANDNLDNGDVSSYGVLDLFAGVRDHSGVWEASLWAKNLLDTEAQITRNQLEAGGNYRQANIIQARTVGVTGKYSF